MASVLYSLRANFEEPPCRNLLFLKIEPECEVLDAGQLGALSSESEATSSRYVSASCSALYHSFVVK